jgi:SAM-dependent methyltransferase
MAQAKTYKKRFQDKTKAEKYAKRFESVSHERIDAREQRAVAKIVAGLEGCRSVLDVPCGAGRFANTLGHGGRLLVETDVSREMVAIARRHHNWGGQLHHILPRSKCAMFLCEFRSVTRRGVVVTFFDYRMLAPVRKALNKIKRAKIWYDEQPSFEEFAAEVKECGFRIVKLLPTGPVWVAEKYLALEKAC